MKFRLKTLSMLAAAAALTLTGCSNDDLVLDGGVDGTTEYSGRVVYLNAGIALPTAGGTRSATEDDPTDEDAENPSTGKTNSDAETDYEYGYDYENEVRSVLLVIANEKDELLTHTVIGSLTKGPVTGKPFDFTAKGEIKYEALQAAYNETTGVLKDSKKVRVYAFCNYTANLLAKIEAEEDSISKGLKTDKAAWINLSGTVTEPASPVTHTPDIQNTIWAKRSFLMSNAKVAEYKFPDKLDDWEPYADKSNPYKLTDDKGTQEMDLVPIYVERSSARIDFRDGSRDDKNNPETPNTYALRIDTNGDEKGDLNLVSVRLNRMSLVNMSKNFYYLRHVSADGTSTGAQVCMPEWSNNYVVDTDWKAKQTEKGINAGNASQYFNFCLYNADGTQYNRDAWYIDKIDDVLNGERDTWPEYDENDPSLNKYKIWRYVTENTIPQAATGDPFSQQKTVQSTGVVFKGSIVLGQDAAKEDEATQEKVAKYMSNAVIDALKEAEKGKNADATKLPDLYSFNNLLYAGVADLVDRAVAEGKGSPLYLAVEKTLNNWRLKDENGKKVYTYGYVIEGADKTVKMDTLTVMKADSILNPTDDRKITDRTINFGAKKEELFSNAAPANNITVYEATDENDGDGWGYYCYYFYWNRHNDNGLSGKMGRMEFSTVRNNVYKLAVTAIGKLGHPRDTKHDPDPVDPEDPDEEPLNYIQVKVEVLPWVVRVNDIVFD